MLITFIGGVGTLIGPGSPARCFYVLVREQLAVTLAQVHQVIFGVLFILVVLVLPGRAGRRLGAHQAARVRWRSATRRAGTAAGGGARCAAVTAGRRSGGRPGSFEQQRRLRHLCVQSAERPGFTLARYRQAFAFELTEDARAAVDDDCIKSIRPVEKDERLSSLPGVAGLEVGVWPQATPPWPRIPAAGQVFRGQHGLVGLEQRRQTNQVDGLARQVLGMLVADGLVVPRRVQQVAGVVQRVEHEQALEVLRRHFYPALVRQADDCSPATARLPELLDVVFGRHAAAEHRALGQPLTSWTIAVYSSRSAANSASTRSTSGGDNSSSPRFLRPAHAPSIGPHASTCHNVMRPRNRATGVDY